MPDVPPIPKRLKILIDLTINHLGPEYAELIRELAETSFTCGCVEAAKDLQLLVTETDSRA